MRVVPPIKRVAITGASGFTGGALTSALRKLGYEVKGFGRGQDASWGSAGELGDSNDLRDFFSSYLPDIVVHLAGVASPAHGSIAEIYDANVTGTATLLQCLLDLKVFPGIIIVASSAAVYAHKNSAGPLAETDAVQPRSHYGISKHSVEQICDLFSSSLNIRVVRPFNYTGRGQSIAFLVPKLVSHFARGATSIELGNLNLERDISDIDDVVESYCRLITIPAGVPVNICSGVTVKLDLILEMLSEISGRKVRVKQNPSLIRINEPYRICGDRQLLDTLIGQWARRPIYETLIQMYETAYSAVTSEA